MAQLRHRSTRSLDPYRVSALAFADQLLPSLDDPCATCWPGWALTAKRRSREPPEHFFSGHISGAERQPNGNVLVCEGASGRAALRAR
jgi:hypothetical protein